MDSNLRNAMIASYTFIIIPISFRISQLFHTARTKWCKNDNLSIWLSDNSKWLYLLNIILEYSSNCDSILVFSPL